MQHCLFFCNSTCKLVAHQDLELVLEVLGVGILAGLRVLERREPEAPALSLVEGVDDHLNVHDALHLLLEFPQEKLLREIGTKRKKRRRDKTRRSERQENMR